MDLLAAERGPCLSGGCQLSASLVLLRIGLLANKVTWRGGSEARQRALDFVWGRYACSHGTCLQSHCSCHSIAPDRRSPELPFLTERPPALDAATKARCYYSFPHATFASFPSPPLRPCRSRFDVNATISGTLIASSSPPSPNRELSTDHDPRLDPLTQYHRQRQPECVWTSRGSSSPAASG